MQKKSLPILFFILLAQVFGFYACSNDSQPTESQSGKADSLRFVESSAGLPGDGQWRHGLAFYDMNKDRNLDILAPPPRKAPQRDHRPFIWLGNGKGEWTAEVLSVPHSKYDYGGVAAGDFNGDGIPDMTLAMHMTGLKGLKGEGDHHYGEFNSGLPGNFESRAVVSADFNNDGVDDVAAVAEADFGGRPKPPRLGISVCLGSKSGWQCSIVEGPETLKWLFADQIITGDVNGDGNADIGVGSLQHRADLIVWVGDGKGGFSPFNLNLPQKLHYPSIAFADIDRDGRDDLIASLGGFGRKGVKALKAFMSRKDGFKDMSEGLPGDQAYVAVGAGDLNGDGVPEIVGGTPAGRLDIFSYKEGKWKRKAASGLSETNNGEFFNIYCIDVNKDGFDDIVFNHYSENVGGGIRVFLTIPQQRQQSSGH
jgi:hypothetical protein